MMRTVSAAAGRQARIVIAGWEYGRERPEPEEQNQENGDSTPHLEPMLHDRLAIKEHVSRGQVSSVISGAIKNARGKCRCLKSISPYRRWLVKKVLRNYA